MWILLPQMHILLLLLSLVVVAVVVVAVVVVVLVAERLMVLVVNRISSSCGSSKIFTWTGKYKSGVGARAGKYKLTARAGKYKFGARAGKYKLTARASRYKLGAKAGKYKLRARAGKYKLGARAGDQAKGRGLGNTKTPMYHKIRQEQGLNVTRDQVYPAMTDVAPEGLEKRKPILKKKKTKSTFSSVSPNWVISIDEHDKLMRYQNSTFPLAVYGCMDTASQKLLFIRAWTSISNPVYPALWYLEHLYESKTFPDHIRIDKGSETTIMATMQVFLSNKRPNIFTSDEACSTVIYGPSTSNQV